MNPIASYLQDIDKSLRRGNSTEHTHRPALKTLIESISRKHTATNEPTRETCGAPDYSVTTDSKHGLVTTGYIEAKDVGADLGDVEDGEQLRRYLKGLQNLILTDYLEFRWYVGGQLRGTAKLATLGKGRKLVEQPGGAAQVRALIEGFLEQSPQEVNSPRDLAERLAKLTHLIRDVVVAAFTSDKASKTLRDLRGAFAETLLPEIDRPENTGEFADMYAQTLAYGLFAARCNHRRGTPFVRQIAAEEIPKTNPFLRQLFDTITGPDMTDEPYAGLVDDLVALLDRTSIEEVLADFGKRARLDPVVHFYETFLAAYDPKLRELRGVYYTPEPVVSYIVRSVDWILRNKFQVPGGLADSAETSYMVQRVDPHTRKTVQETRTSSRVLILDPACGTGTFLYSVVDRIRDEFVRGDNAGKWSTYVGKHLLPRLLGFELLMAPYAVAHLKLGMQLAAQDLPDGLRKKWAYDFEGADRLGVYLTNTLEEAERQVESLFGPFRVITEEANAASRIKRELPIMVVLGNPPYSGHSANQGAWITKLIEDYKSIAGKRLQLGQAKWLQNDYVKFIRFAEHRITQTGHGVLAFITDHGYLTSGTFVGMRAHLAATFDELYVLDLQGNEKLNKNRPDKDENVFDITQGVAIVLGVRLPSREAEATVKVSRVRGDRQAKYEMLSTSGINTTDWEDPRFREPYFLLTSTRSSHLDEYERCPSILEVFPGVRSSARARRVGTGFVSTHDDFAIGFTPREVEDNVKRLVATPSEAAARELFSLCTQEQWNYANAKAALSGIEVSGQVEPITYRPFDTRFTVWNPHVCVHRRVEVHRHVKAGRLAILVGQAGNVIGSDVWDLAFVTRTPVDFNVFYRGGSAVLPAYLAPESELAGERPLFGGDSAVAPNLSEAVVVMLQQATGLQFTRVPRGDLRKTVGVEDIVAYVYSIMFAPSYRERYSAMLDLDFPRIPMSPPHGIFAALVPLGAELIAVHLMESEKLDQPRASYPTKGSNEIEERFPKYFAPGSPALGTEELLVHGRVYINPGSEKSANGAQFFDNVAPEIWAYRIGGYQVCEKWLKDRQRAKYGGALTYEDIERYQRIVGAVRETIRLQREIDATIDANGGWPGAFQGVVTSKDSTPRVRSVAEPSAKFGSSERKRKR